MSTRESIFASEFDAGTTGEEETVGVELSEESVLDELVAERNAGLTVARKGVKDKKSC